VVGVLLTGFRTEDEESTASSIAAMCPSCVVLSTLMMVLRSACLRWHCVVDL